jgi:hypothetical protein
MMNLSGVGLGGVMASFGAAQRAGFPRPFVVDRVGRLYHMNPSTAALFLEALERWR